MYAMEDWEVRAVTREVEVLIYIVRYYRQHGYGPSYDDMENELGYPRATLFDVLRHLRRQGLVSWEERKSRTLRPLVAEVPAKVT